MSRKKNHAAANHERWLVSYADFVTMIFALFVVLFASARSDHSRQADISMAIQAAFTQLGIFAPAAKGPTVTAQVAASAVTGASIVSEDNTEFLGTPQQRADLVALKRRLEEVLATEIREQTVALRLSRDGLVISLLEAGFFDSGSAMYKATSAPTIERIAQRLKAVPNDLRIEGHTDNVPIHSVQFATNWELSTARATNIARLLIEQYHYDPGKLSAAGYAQYRPFDSNSDEIGRARNRRVDIVVLPIVVSGKGRPLPVKGNQS
jgi:chemotaxis protein MotB